MKRLTTDHPEGNFETALNFVYGKDGAAYLRSDGEQDDVPLHEWAKRQCMARGCGEFPGDTLEEIDQTICECGFDYPDCLVHLAYTFACQAVHLRDRLKMYEDTGLMPEEVERLTAPEPNSPLTLEELREMDGEPVWVRNLCTGDYTCRVIAATDKHFTFFTDGGVKENQSYGKAWLAYRCKPEDGTENKMEVEQYEKV